MKTLLRGGYYIICKSYAKAKNEFFDSYNVNKATLCTIYLDTINLCGHSMMQLLPTEILDWLNPKKSNPDSYFKDSRIDCFIKVNLGWSDRLLGLCKDYPLVGEKNKSNKVIVVPLLIKR